MRPRPHRFRLLAASLLAVLLAATPGLVRAQDGPGGPIVTPPARVGRLGWLRGTVSMRPNGATDWEPASVNYPLNAGDAVWTQPGAAAGVQVSDTGFDLAPGTEFDLDALDPARLTATLPQGEAVVRIHRLFPGERYTLRTPRGTVRLIEPGDYEIAAGSTASPTLVTVFRGRAELSGPASLDLHSGQTAMISGERNFAVQVTPAMHDAFATRMLTPRPVRRYAVAPPPLVAAMPGGSDLDDYGEWAPSPAYGPVWYPRVARGWIPYREGHWAYIAPWGWTWIDSDPWGFAPFHYGRWVEIGPRWAWVPGPVVVAEAPSYPVYAPALVAFFSAGGGFAAGLTVGGLVNGSVGWVPLAPFEPYHPCFRASPAYVREVNIREVRNVTNITNVTVNQVTINRFRNQRAATVVPAAALVASRPVALLARPAPARLLAGARPVLGRAPVAPAAGTLGVTRAVARQQRLAPIAPLVARQLPPALAPRPRPVAPGPAIRPAAARVGGPAGRLPPLATPMGAPMGRPAGAPIGAPRPGAAGPGPVTPGAMRPGAVLPGPARPGLVVPGPARPGPQPVRPGVTLPPPARTALPPVHPVGPGFAPTPHSPMPALRAPGARPTQFPVHPAGPGVAPPPRVITPGAPGPALRPPSGASIQGPRPAAPPLRPGAPVPSRPVPSPGPASRAPQPIARPAPAYRPPPAVYHPPAPAYRPPPAVYHPPAPAYRPPPAVYHPPAPAYRPPPPAYHSPAPVYRPPPAVYHPPAPVYRPPPAVYHPPAPVYRPPPPAYHPPAPAYRPPPPAYHPPAPAYRPPPPAYHPPAPAYHPPPPPPRQQDRKPP